MQFLYLNENSRLHILHYRVHVSYEGHRYFTRDFSQTFFNFVEKACHFSSDIANNEVCVDNFYELDFKNTKKQGFFYKISSHTDLVRFFSSFRLHTVTWEECSQLHSSQVLSWLQHRKRPMQSSSFVRFEFSFFTSKRLKSINKSLIGL